MAVISETKKDRIRNSCIRGAQEYSFLIGKVYMLISETNDVFEVRFCAEDFKHLVGIKSPLGDASFYRSCFNGTLARSNILSNQQKDWNSLKGKEKGILNIKNFLYSDANDVLILEELETNTTIFPLALRNDTKDIAVAFNSSFKARSLRKARHSIKTKRTMNIKCIVCKNEDSFYYTDLVYLSKNAFDIPDFICEKFSKDLSDEIKK